MSLTLQSSKVTFNLLFSSINWLICTSNSLILLSSTTTSFLITSMGTSIFFSIILGPCISRKFTLDRHSSIAILLTLTSSSSSLILLSSNFTTSIGTSTLFSTTLTTSIGTSTFFSMIFGPCISKKLALTLHSSIPIWALLSSSSSSLILPSF